ncbi:MAG: polysaccharide biosynthesis tyrosine autokinase [Ignavibacteria bacterium]|nr:polysaccharide biosynthesis tyrosine autokinase [Ignavibacteria bacterium]MCU7498721.1 polysaccharide biosynthesis tyrosine autokinase [Ignavibacteria bacterium]MCU7512084.1 polysaccharide biosynthesis tyrosine autokinase [Ignavibacteria bacterium]MCU7520617.1 polysaccharide biosynthesis tyrosine autokinase [Ignavibacteria bacterium]MCU7523515.1 polysaccharide biosynthesis tyrosine autokinase [Ignavibacteria bacterium]
MEKLKLSDREPESNSFKDYINLIRNNIIPITLISLTGLVVAIIYAIKAPDIFKSTTVLKVSKPQGSILESPLMPDFQDFGSDRFIANEIEILKSYTVRENVAKALIADYNLEKRKDFFNIILDKKLLQKGKTTPVKSVSVLAEMLEKTAAIDQKRGLDIVEISVESPSPYEASLITNEYAKAYKDYNLQNSRMQLTQVKEFLLGQRKEKQDELLKSEESLRQYQQAGGIVALDEQAKALIEQLSKFDADKNAADIDMKVSEKNLSKYRDELKKQDPRLADYVESFVAEPYVKALQEQIAKIEIQKAIALSSKDAGAVDKKTLNEYDAKIKYLKSQVEQKKATYKAGILASSPEEVKLLTKSVIEEEVKSQAAKSSYQELSKIVGNYEKKFNSLPSATIEYARRERERAALEKLYLLVEEKYQESMINEQSKPGNVLIVDPGRIPEKPAKPNRPLIVLIGLVLGVGMGVGFAFVRNYFDNTIKTPEDIERRNVNVLAWIPKIEGLGPGGNKDLEFIVARKPDSIPAEAYRALRTRVQFSKFENDGIKTILVTSSAPSEGKTTTAVNLAGSFAQANKKTIIIDSDLRKPRLHNVFKAERYPGFTDYVFGEAEFEQIIRKSDVNNLYFATAGTIPPNPSELLGSSHFDDFLRRLKSEFDMIIVDSPPIIAVTDSEILSRKVDASILVVSAEKTEADLMSKSIELLTHEANTFIGVLLNNFSYRAGYGSYYKYYYYYSRPADGKKGLKGVSKSRVLGK